MTLAQNAKSIKKELAFFTTATCSLYFINTILCFATLLMRPRGLITGHFVQILWLTMLGMPDGKISIYVVLIINAALYSIVLFFYSYKFNLKLSVKHIGVLVFVSSALIISLDVVFSYLVLIPAYWVYAVLSVVVAVITIIFSIVVTKSHVQRVQKELAVSFLIMSCGFFLLVSIPRMLGPVYSRDFNSYYIGLAPKVAHVVATYNFSFNYAYMLVVLILQYLFGVLLITHFWSKNKPA